MADIYNAGEQEEFMTLNEVAQYLRVAEKTIFRMVHRGDIPCVRIGSQWRFKRSAINRWLQSKMGKTGTHELVRLIEEASAIVPLSRLTQKDFIIMDMKPGTKEEVLEQLVQPLYKKELLQERDMFVKNLMIREAMASTAMWKGIAAPHVRNPHENNIRQPLIVFGICREGTDYDSFDGTKTFLFCLICINSITAHLRVLARLAEFFKKEDRLARLIKTRNEEEFLGTLIKLDKT
jgi:PTS system nitrogen regulatory IIA component